MKKLNRLFIFLCLFLSTISSFSLTLTSMNLDEVRQKLIDRTLVSITADNFNGRMTQSALFLYFDSSGNVFGKLSQQPQNQPQSDRGYYRLGADGSFYITWLHWDGGRTNHEVFFDTKNVYLAISDTDGFDTAFLKKTIQYGNQAR